MRVALRSQSDLLSHYRTLLRDPLASGGRWSDTEIYLAINRALQTWANRVRVPWLYTLPSGWNSATYAYALPAYMDTYIRPQVLAPAGAWRELAPEGSTDTWADLKGWTLEPDGTGGLVLRWQTPPLTDEGRIVWYAPVSLLPIEAISAAATAVVTITAGPTATSIVVTVPDGFEPAPAGWLAIGGERMAYGGVTRDGNDLTLGLIARGIDGTTAGEQAESTTVEWCVGVDRGDLWGVLDDQVMENLHGYFMTDGSNSERDHHAVMMKYHGDRVSLFWRTYVPSFWPRMLWTREMLGPRTY